MCCDFFSSSFPLVFCSSWRLCACLCRYGRQAFARYNPFSLARSLRLLKPQRCHDTKCLDTRLPRNIGFHSSCLRVPESPLPPACQNTTAYRSLRLGERLISLIFFWVTVKEAFLSVELSDLFDILSHLNRPQVRPVLVFHREVADVGCLSRQIYPE